MNSVINKFFNVFLLCRPYTLFCIFLLAILGNIISVGKLVFSSSLFLDLSLACCFWLGIIYLGEYLHKNVDNRDSFSLLIPSFFLIVSFLIISLKAPLGLLLFFFSILAVFFYSSKVKNWLLSPVMFIFRGVIEASIFLIVLLVHGKILSGPMVLFVFSIYFLTISRNLVGDLRDARFDKYAFPRKFGSLLTKILIVAFGVISILLLPDFLSAVPVIVPLFLLIGGFDFYFIHHFYVFSTYFFFLLLMAYFLSFDQSLLLLAYFSLLFWVTYKIVPRRSNHNIPLYWRVFFLIVEDLILLIRTLICDNLGGGCKSIFATNLTKSLFSCWL